MIRERMPLPCGHVLQFCANGAPGEAQELAHQKDEIIRRSYNQWLFSTGRYSGYAPPSSLLEIGVCRGGSLALWRSLWPVCRVVGVDNDLGQVTTNCLAHFDEIGGIELVGLTMPDPKVRELGTFEMIIDDGGHGPKAVFPAMDLCWDMLTPGGVYVVEDWHHDFLQPQELHAHCAAYLHDGRATNFHVFPAILVLEKAR